MQPVIEIGGPITPGRISLVLTRGVAPEPAFGTVGVVVVPGVGAAGVAAGVLGDVAGCDGVVVGVDGAVDGVGVVGCAGVMGGGAAGGVPGCAGGVAGWAGAGGWALSSAEASVRPRTVVATAVANGRHVLHEVMSR